MAFPSSPLNGQQYTIGNSTWEWSSAGSRWNLVDATKLPPTTTQVFTSSGTWTIPINGYMAHITLIGGGGGGQPGTSSSSSVGGGGAGGGGGALTSALIDLTYLIANTPFATITIGTGGTSNTAGGNTVFEFLKAGGGGAGTGNSSIGGFGQFRGGYGGAGGLVNATGVVGTPTVGQSSYGAAGGGKGGSASNASFSQNGANGGDSPVYSMTTGGVYASNIQNMPVPGIVDNTGTPKYGAGGNGGNYSSGTVTNGQTGANGLVVIKTWYKY
jgi:hypothetical protein